MCCVFIYLLINSLIYFINLFHKITYNLRLIQGKQSSVTTSLEHSLDALKVENKLISHNDIIAIMASCPEKDDHFKLVYGFIPITII